MEKDHSTESSLSVVRLIFLSAIVALPCILPGFAYGYSSVALPQLQLSTSDASWFGSLSLLGCFFGSLVCAYVIDKHGRKTCLIVSIIPSIFGWILLSLSYTQFRGNMGRFLTGLTTGAASYISIVYFAECIVRYRLKQRSSFTFLGALSTTFGVSISFMLGTYLPCQTEAFIFAILSAIFLFLIATFLPESPLWLYQKGRIGDAEYAAKCLRLHLSIFENEKNPSLTSDKTEFRQKTGSFGLLRRKDVYKPLLMTIVLLGLAVLGGGMVLTAYMVDTIKTDTLSYKSAYMYTNISGILSIFLTASVIFLLPHTGNRFLTLFSTSGMAIGMALIGFTASYKNPQYQYEIDIVHVASVLFSSAMFSFGCFTLPGLLLGEVFPTDAQGLASVPVLIQSLLSTVATKYHLPLYDIYGGDIFYVYAFLSAIQVIVVYLLMPETVGKTVKEVRDNYI